MKVKEVIDMLSYGTGYILVGARTGKVLHDSMQNRKEHAKKYYECYVSNTPLYADMAIRKNRIFKSQCEWACPRIGIYVSGE